MVTRMLSSALAAVALLAATPALAAEDAPSKQPCTCCSDGSVHPVDHRLRNERQDAQDLPVNGSTSDDPFLRNQSFGG